MTGVSPQADYDAAADTWTVRVLIQPGARKNGVVGLLDDRIKLKIAAPAVDNKANIALVRYLSAIAGIGSGNIEIVQGVHSRRKCLIVKGAGTGFIKLLEQAETEKT